MKDRTFCDDLMGDYYMCLNIQISLVSEIIIQSAALANTENNFWNYSKCRARGKVTNYFTTNLMRLIA